MKKQSVSPLISSAQLAVLLCVCRLPGILLELSGEGESSVWAALLGEGLRLVCCLPVCLLLAKGWQLPEKGLWGTLLRLTAAGFLVLELSRLLVKTGLFMTDTLYPDFSAFFFGVILLLLAIYGAHMGLEAAARAALPVLVVFAAAMLLTALGVREEMRLIHLRPVENAAEIFRTAADINPLPELLIFLTAAPRTSGRGGKTLPLLWAFGLSAVLFSAAALLCGLVLGGLQSGTVYSFFKVETIMRLSIFQRMDAWFLAIWTFVLFIRALFLLWSAEQLLSPLAVRGRRLLLPVLGAGALAVSLLLLRQDALSRQLMRCIENGWWLTAVFILLAAALLCRKGRKRS